MQILHHQKTPVKQQTFGQYVYRLVWKKVACSTIDASVKNHYICLSAFISERQSSV